MLQLTAMPPQIAKLPLDNRGYPIPWFVASINGERDFRVADQRKLWIAIQDKLCWVCGQPLFPRTMTFDVRDQSHSRRAAVSSGVRRVLSEELSVPHNAACGAPRGEHAG